MRDDYWEGPISGFPSPIFDLSSGRQTDMTSSALMYRLRPRLIVLAAFDALVWVGSLLLLAIPSDLVHGVVKKLVNLPESNNSKNTPKSEFVLNVTSQLSPLRPPE